MDLRRTAPVRLATLATGGLLFIVSIPVPAQVGASCSARSAATVVPVVELYTSEGCNTCPKADRWLSALRAEPAVVALAFHVDYWDRLGWRDRFADPRFSQRQAQQQVVNGARFSYTPQVVVAGVDRRDWASWLPSLFPRQTARVALTLTRSADGYVATVLPAADAPPRLAAYWAVAENGHVSTILAGENEGATLRHDFVVRDYRPVAPWIARPGNVATLRLEPARTAASGSAPAIQLVVIDAANGKPLQALKLGC
jgi:hypothetical protein